MKFGTHRCELDGRYSGGNCVALPCTENLILNHSVTDCSNADCGMVGPGFVPCGDHCVLSLSPCVRTYAGAVTMEACRYACDEGYVATGRHVCQPDGAYSGGSCAANDCTRGLTLEHGNMTCSGVTGDTCRYGCEPGYHPSSSHVCLPSGTFEGGACVANSCTGGLRLLHSTTECNGATADVCDYTCDPGHTQVGSHVCGIDGSFRGGECRPNPCLDGLIVPHS